MKRVLVIDGGGLKGIIPAFVVEAIEKKEGKPCHELFDLICGTSTGSVIGGVLAAGCKGSTVRKLYCETVPKLFTPRNRFNPFTWSKPEKYDRDPFMEEIGKYSNYCSLQDVKTLFLTTAFNLCSGRTHFIHSDDRTENFYALNHVISWSALSAALYFGKIQAKSFAWKSYKPGGEVVSKTGAVFQDGGQGTQNSPVVVAMIEAIGRWKDESIEIVSLGCGDQDMTVDYNKAAKSGIIKQVTGFFGQARGESSKMQYLGAALLDKYWANLEFRRLNVAIPAKYDKLDGRKFVDEYMTLGSKLAEKY